MALPHAHPLEVIDLHVAPHADTGGVSTSLLKTAGMQLLRLVLPAGHTLPEHHVAGEITVHCLAGEIILDVGGRTSRMIAGQLTALPGGQPHALRAVQDATVLVTLLHPA
jgi:quercetin dioxygenase-like cupin family protein